MQSIEPATSLTAVPGVLVTQPATTPPAVVRAAPADAVVRRTPDVAAFGSDSFAVFSVDQATGTTRIAVYDGEGRLLRMIPPHGVAEMLSQISAYRRLR